MNYGEVMGYLSEYIWLLPYIFYINTDVCHLGYASRLYTQVCMQGIPRSFLFPEVKPYHYLAEVAVSFIFLVLFFHSSCLML